MGKLSDFALTGNQGKAQENRMLVPEFRQRESSLPISSSNQPSWPGQTKIDGGSQPGRMILPLGDQKGASGKLR